MPTIVDVSHLSDDHIKEEILLTQRRLLIETAKAKMSDFCKLMMPDPDNPDDVTLTEYQSVGHARLLCDIVERVAIGKSKRLAVSMPPQHGKTIHLSQMGLAWIWGQKPRARIVVITYNQDRADELGQNFRQMIKDRPVYKQVFPEVVLAKDMKSKRIMQNTLGGKIFFVGIGGTITGRTADYTFIDDPFKGDPDEFTQANLAKVWKWLFSVVFSRGNNRTRICIIHTRWHEDDTIGRLCDPDHPERNKKYAGIAKKWEYMNIPGVIKSKELASALGLALEVPTDPDVIDQFGNESMTALWPEDKSLVFLAEWKRGDSQGFSSLVMGKPTPDDGIYFTNDMIVPYSRDELPDNLVIYGASDHAVSERQTADFTVIGCVGIDDNDDIWVLPDLVMDRMETLKTVDGILVKMKTHKPSIWWSESELISKSFGPFLKKRMYEERVYVTIDPIKPSADKKTRARSIQGRMAMRKVRFPVFASWWADAKNQLLKFPNATHDDFVDFLAYIGLGLNKEIAPSRPKEDKTIYPQVGTIEWVKFNSSFNKKRQLLSSRAGW